MKSFDLEVAKKSPDYFLELGDHSPEEVWKLTVDLYREILPAAEEAGVRIVWEGEDPPIRDYRGIYRPLTTYRDIDKLLDEVSSENIGIIYCIGARHEAGDDVIEGIKYFGRKGKIFHVHFRNVRGKIPSWEECFLDEGDLNMWQILKTLREINYTGYIAPPSFSHNPRILNQKFPDRISMALAVGYTKAMVDILYQ